MIRYFAALFFLQCALLVEAGDLTGIYNYNKGLNKANGTICFFQIKPDSAFFYLNNMSGAPDFNLTNLKGFLRIDSNTCTYRKDSCIVNFVINGGVFSAVQNARCKNDFSVEGKYKKLNTVLKKPNTWMTEYTEKSGVISTDSAVLYLAPHPEAKVLMNLPPDTSVKVIDEINGYYLIEIPKKKNEFMWTSKKNVKVAKN